MSKNENESESESESENENENENTIVSYDSQHLDTSLLKIIPTIIIRSPPMSLLSSSQFVLPAHRTMMTTMMSGGSGTTTLPLGGFKS
jgi:hypothetical protein